MFTATQVISAPGLTLASWNSPPYTAYTVLTASVNNALGITDPSQFLPVQVMGMSTVSSAKMMSSTNSIINSSSSIKSIDSMKQQQQESRCNTPS